MDHVGAHGAPSALNPAFVLRLGILILRFSTLTDVPSPDVYATNTGSPPQWISQPQLGTLYFRRSTPMNLTEPLTTSTLVQSRSCPQAVYFRQVP